MSDDRFSEFLRGAAHGYHRPPEPPRAEMWARIQAERARRASAPVVRVRWVPWSLAAAAVLALGIALGRMSAPNGQPETAAGVTETSTSGSAYRVAAAEHLRLVETFLTVFRAEAAVPSLQLASGAARELLLTTRLVMDSPAGQDPGLVTLLKDVELVLAQIASLAGRHDPGELDLIDQGMERRGVLIRLRAMESAGSRTSSVQGEL
ncbi:MAG TPA: hypothetical protein VD793_00455 [Gemmatimonadales bacterium]|nr:hypothetical protein [Gemmatimonadales bacterium]